MTRLIAALAACMAVSFANPALTLADLNLDPQKSVGVSFTPSVSIPGVRLDASERKAMRRYQTDGGVYTVLVAADRTAPTIPPGDINYYLYSQLSAAPDKDVFTEHVIIGTPRGEFVDQWGWVQFELNEKYTHKGMLALPLRSASTAPLIAIEPERASGIVFLSRAEHKVAFDAKNLLKGIDVYVDLAQLTALNEDYWKWPNGVRNLPVAFTSQTSGPPYVVEPPSLQGVTRPEPRLWRTIFASARSIRADEPHDRLYLTVRHSAAMGGTPRAIRFAIDVRFRPPWWSLLAFAVIGSLLGSAVTLLFPAAWNAASPLRTIGSAALLAVVVELLGMLMFMSDQSKLVIGSINLDPTQVLPALGLGILVGLLGIRTLEAFKIPLPIKPGARNA